MSFGEYLCQQGRVTPSQLAEATRIWPGHVDTIGALGLKLGFLTMDQIDVLLEEQSRQGRRFGELAIQQGFLTAEQVGRLLEVQRLDRDLDLGKVLLVAGHLTVAALTEELARYVAGRESTHA